MQLMNELIYAAQQDISMPDYVLKTCDFNQDGRITVEDSLCMQYFNGMELGNPATLLAAGQTIPSSCMNVYTLDQCQGIPGDINGDLKIDELDEILIMLVEAEQITGDDESCSDVNEELGVTIEDVECVKSYVNGNREYYFICIGCSDITPAAYRAEYEICNDGFDNDCNGLTDRTSMNPADDWCMCNANTPCWMVWDSDGGVVPGISDGNVKVCRKNNWDENTNATAGAASGYRWSSPMEFLCDENKECETTECKDTLWKCMYDSTNGFTWIDSPSKAPKEDDDPMGSPKTCEDGYDNDCLCGDMKCKEIEAGNMFSSWQFWVGFVLGAVLAIFCPPCSVALFYLSLAASAATIFFGEELGPEWSAALSGFSMGVSVGTIVKSAATAMTKTAATKAGEEAGKSAAGEATKTATKEAAEKGLTEEATKEYVKKAAEDAAKKAAEEAYKKAAEEAAKEAGKDLASESTKSTIKTGATEAGKAAVAEAGHVAASATLMGAVKDLFASLVSSNPFQSQIWSMVAFGAASMGMQKAAIEYANSTAEWKAVKQTCTENA